MQKQEAIDFFKDVGLRRNAYRLLASELVLKPLNEFQFNTVFEALRQAFIGEDEFAHFRLINSIEMNDKGDLIGFFREAIGDDRLIGDCLLASAGRLFDELCVPEEIMPDSPIMQTPEMNTLSAMWAYINSAEIQAEMEDRKGPRYHHDYAEGIYVVLTTTAHVLDERMEQEGKDWATEKFIDIFQLTPEQFLQKYWGEVN